MPVSPEIRCASSRCASSIGTGDALPGSRTVTAVLDRIVQDPRITGHSHLSA
ncbi:hypothetical protein ACFY04_23075 [Streptomyces sp. NPDC001549]|uniref:hypothetical protein n=1 Tax=Streptomyces sp. NPDC001549 TaxID=3364586 RepID=UPI00367EDCE7